MKTDSVCTPGGLYRLSRTFSEDEDREDGHLDSHTSFPYREIPYSPHIFSGLSFLKSN